MSRLAGRDAVRVGRAINTLRKEGVEEEQAIAKAYRMEKAGSLRDDGSYVRAKK